MFILTFDFGKRAPLRLHINFGGVVAEANDENSLLGALAVEYAPSDFISLFAEVSAQPRWTSVAVDHNFRKDPIWATPGIRVSAPGGLYFCLTGDFGLSSKQQRYNWHQKGYSYSTGVQPDYGIRFTFGWSGFVTTQDRDHDGVPDNIDRCPDDSGPASNYGCPEPDADKDGVCDPWVSQKHKESQYAAVCKGVDKCPTKPEDVDGFQDDDGCPDLDNDGDGIPDAKDLCPNEPEDFDGFQDDDGCPDFDNDHDGIPDSIDKCPNEPEDLDGFEDNDGCPDLDNDKDGIPDLQDKCPNEPGPASNNGCPEPAPAPVVPPKEPNFPAQQVLRGVTFVSNTPEMTFESFQWLDAIVNNLKEFPAIEIEVCCYADGTSKRPPPMQLTQSRAESVRQYIVAQGVDSNRIRAIGYGSASPIADNRTAAGRALNRRIEIVRTR
jgi:outer membrane protein OmpA-like peptidoglycan-associated protein